METVIVTKSHELTRIIAACVEAATARILEHKNQATAAVPKEWLTNRETMEFLGVSKTTLHRYRKSGRLPFAKLGGGIFYRYTDLVAVLEANLAGASH